jgi:hypothetical protein
MGTEFMSQNLDLWPSMTTVRLLMAELARPATSFTQHSPQDVDARESADLTRKRQYV